MVNSLPRGVLIFTYKFNISIIIDTPSKIEYVARSSRICAVNENENKYSKLLTAKIKTNFFCARLSEYESLNIVII